MPHPGAHRLDEPGRGIPWCGCSPAEPTSVSHDVVEYSMRFLSFEVSLFACFFEFAVALLEDVLLSPFQFVLGCQVTYRTVQAARIVVLDVFGDEAFGIVEGQRRSGPDAFLLEGLVPPFDLAVALRIER